MGLRVVKRHRAACEICGQAGLPAFKLPGAQAGRAFELLRCPHCAFLWVAEPLQDLAALYDRAYYEGRGADPLVSYMDELEHPDDCVRKLDWEGLERAVRGQRPLGPQTRWLDLGCGNGGLVRQLRSRGFQHAEGTEQGWIAAQARKRGIPVLPWSKVKGRRYDVVSAIEVLEHVRDPLALLRSVRRLLKPGGLFFYTTGNAGAWPLPLEHWPYLRPPELHISFYNPVCMRLALERCGFVPEPWRDRGSLDLLYGFRLAKNLKRKRLGAFERALVQRPLAWMMEALWGIGGLPLGGVPA